MGIWGARAPYEWAGAIIAAAPADRARLWEDVPPAYREIVAISIKDLAFKRAIMRRNWARLSPARRAEVSQALGPK